MEAKSWQQIESLYYQAIRLETTKREAFLRQVRAEDETLFDELQTLLVFHEKNNSFLEKPVLEDAAAELLNTRPNQLTSGKRFGVYKVIMLLGAGGMGEVYLAEDTRLGRKVALKILPPDLVHNTFLIERFQQEARAASALNHPNVLTVYEVGQDSSGIHFIATEYVDGETLRQILSSRRELNLTEILDIAVQTAAALAAVHETGVIHRDVKPQNIMVRRDGYVKVLDFGIAKLIGKRFLNQETSQPSNTDTGMILGTAHYMSPEQARGLKVNPQTDLWSFGVTLYEMLTKQVPFAGATTSDVIVSILEREPPSLTELAPGVPPELERIIKRCLSKDISDRYQNAAEIVKDLQELSQQTQNSGDSIRLNRQSFLPKNRTTAENNQQTTNSGATLHHPQRRSKRAPFGSASLIKINSWNALFAIAAVVLMTFMIGVVLTNSGRNTNWSINPFSTKTTVSPFQTAQVTRLTNSGNVFFANLSPDGKYLAYVVSEAGEQSLWLRQIAAPPARMILPSSGNLYRGISFSPDSNFIYYVVHDKTKGRGVLYSLPTFGGEARRILEDIDSPIAFAPDGKSFAFLRGTNDGGIVGHALIIAKSDGVETKTLAFHRDPELFSREGFTWSVDGESIIVAAAKPAANDAPKLMHLVEIKVADGSEKPFSLTEWKNIGRIAAIKNGDLIITATEQTANLAQIYQVSPQTAEFKTVTKDLNGYSGVSISADSNVIAVIQSERVSHLWTATTDNLDQMKRITPGVGRYYWSSWTPDGKIIYMSEESGNQDLWMMDSDGSNPKQLTFDLSTDSFPKVTPDNRYIIFSSNRSGATRLWRMDRDGSNLKMLSNDLIDSSAFSLDNNFVYHTAPKSNSWFLSKVSIESGTTTRLLDFPSIHGAISPSGKLIAFLHLYEKTTSKWKVGIASTIDGKIVKTFDVPTDLPWQIVRWTKNGEALTYLDVRNGVYNLWQLSIDDNRVGQLTHSNSSDQILYYDWSLNEKEIVYLRGQRISDAVVLSVPSK